MIIARAPLRIGFFGGGSDMESFFKHEESGGTVVSVTIDAFVYVVVHKTPNKHIKVTYNDTEIVTDVNDLKHDRIREALKYFKIYSNIEISSFADIPSAGSGLGSSSAFTAALHKALLKFKSDEIGIDLSQISDYGLAEDVVKTEIERCKSNIGWQDQYASVFGGFNKINFYASGEVYVRSLDSTEYHLDSLQSKLLLFRVGSPRDAGEVLSSKPHKNKHEMIKKLTYIARAVPDLIKLKKYKMLGELLHDSWCIKRETNELVSNQYIDEIYDIGIKAGAWGGKLCGAGSSGHMLFMAPESKHSKIIQDMKECGIEQFKFQFSYEPTTILYSN